VHQDVDLYAALLGAGGRVELALRPGRRAWLQVARGELELNGVRLGAGDGAAVTAERTLRIDDTKDAELLLFDLA
jgi:redox-sensitive bicupin YhaK (pirin superfamily)